MVGDGGRLRLVQAQPATAGASAAAPRGIVRAWGSIGSTTPGPRSSAGSSRRSPIRTARRPSRASTSRATGATLVTVSREVVLSPVRDTPDDPPVRADRGLGTRSAGRAAAGRSTTGSRSGTSRSTRRFCGWSPSGSSTHPGASRAAASFTTAPRGGSSRSANSRARNLCAASSSNPTAGCSSPSPDSRMRA